MARLRVSIVFESGARIGPGKARLLENIRETGSISGAAREMGMSYKRAWVLLDSINRAFTEPVVKAAPGMMRSAYGRQTPPPDYELTCVEPGSPMGERLRRYWQPVCTSHCSAPITPARVAQSSRRQCLIAYAPDE
jgi:hypothetical protein